jgi:hypothetical protein
VPADKAYLSIENLELADKLGATAFVPFKVNSTSGEAGSIWERKFHYYHFRRDEFLPHYHQRSNAESTFSMVKAKFRDHVRSKTGVPMKPADPRPRKACGADAPSGLPRSASPVISGPPR